MLQTRYTLIYVALMTLVVVSSNFLVQFPLNVTVAGVNLADLLTWGAFTYPVAFLITDLTNRQFGPQSARKVVLADFRVGVALGRAVGGVLLGTSPDAIWWGGALVMALPAVGSVRLGNRIPDPLVPTKAPPLQAASEAT